MQEDPNVEKIQWRGCGSLGLLGSGQRLRIEGLD